MYEGTHWAAFLAAACLASAGAFLGSSITCFCCGPRLVFLLQPEAVRCFTSELLCPIFMCHPNLWPLIKYSQRMVCNCALHLPVLTFVVCLVLFLTVHPATMVCTCAHSFSVYEFPGGLDLHLPQTPKLLSLCRTEWAPKAFCVSFKLETDLSILIKKAKGAIQNYG